MRTVSAADAAVRAGNSRLARVRVFVFDSGGVWRDLTTYPGENMVVGATWREDVDANGITAEVTLKRQADHLSLSPFHETSPVNRAWNPANAFAPLVTIGRRLRIEWSLTAEDAPAAVWNQAFSGFIDKVTFPGDTMTLECRDLVAELQDTYIEEELAYAYAQGLAAKGVHIFEKNRTYNTNTLVIPTEANRNGHYYEVLTGGTTSTTAEPTWPTGTSATVVSGSVTFREVGVTSTTAGTALETVIQRILNDNMAGPPSLYTPVSPGWLLKFYLQSRVSIWEAIRSLVDQIGWDLRYRWDAGSSLWRLTLQEPSRAKTTPDATIQTSECLDVSTAQQSIEGIRNAVRVIFSNSADLDTQGQPRRTKVDRTDAGSVTLFGRRYMELAEGAASNIDTVSEANALADAVVSDLALPVVDMGVELLFFPWVELGDLYTFQADGERFTAAQNLAVTGYEHRVENGRASTSLTVRGKPSGGYARWLRRAGEVQRGDIHDMQLFNSGLGIALGAAAVVGGTKLGTAALEAKFSHGTEIEFHVSRQQFFTPDANTTLVSSGRDKSTVLANLVPGAVYYAKAIPRAFNGKRPVLGMPSEELTFTAGRARAGHYEAGVSQAHFPLNGSFEHASDDLATAPFDHWQMVSGSTWGATGDVTSGTHADYGSTVLLRGTANVGAIRSSIFPIRRTNSAYSLFVVSKGGGSSAGLGTKRLEVLVEFFKDSAGATPSVALASRLHQYSSGPSGVWQQQKSKHQSQPSDANFARITLRKESADANLNIEVGDVFMVEALVEAEGWLSPSFTNSWTDFGGSDETAAYRKTNGRDVQLRGYVKRTVAGIGSGVPMFTLPSGYRPPADVHFAVNGNDKHAHLVVTTAGAVYVKAGDAANPENAVSLDGVRFHLDAL